MWLRNVLVRHGKRESVCKVYLTSNGVFEKLSSLGGDQDGSMYYKHALLLRDQCFTPSANGRIE